MSTSFLGFHDPQRRLFFWRSYLLHGLLWVPLLLGLVAQAVPHSDSGVPRAWAQEIQRSGEIPEGRGHRLPLEVSAPTSRDAAENLVVRALDIPDSPYGAGHRVVDLAASPGDEVLASSGGTVSFAGPVAGTPVITIAHGGDLHTTYEPVIAEVAKGEKVVRGQRIGRLADTATLPKTARTPDGLSWGAWLRAKGGKKKYLDPFTLLGEVRVRLLS